MSSILSDITMPGMFIALLVLVCLCALLGSVYLYIYCRYLRPKARTKRYGEAKSDKKIDDKKKTNKYTHMFLFKKR